MDILKFLKPIETLPDRFSNLAFWRCLRVFRETIVNVFTYIDTWGEGIEIEQSTQNSRLSKLESLTYDGNASNFSTHTVEIECEPLDAGNGLVVIRPSESVITVTDVPHFVSAIALFPVYTAADQSTVESISVNVPFYVGASSEGSKIILHKWEIYAPYGYPTSVTSFTLYYTLHT